MRKTWVAHLFQPLYLFCALFLFVLLVNLPIIQFNFVYPEQALIYVANQKIASFLDLINVYIHPQLFHFDIPFFRPSGHFLIYQLITPIIGWNNQYFIIVNLFFLTLTGYFTIRLYQLLFPYYVYGGYIAFAIYMMHPSLILSRLISLHFEFAYVAFLMAGLYYFSLFCLRNNLSAKTPLTHYQFQHLRLFYIAIFLYIVAATFKEPAVMLAPLMGIFLFIYSGAQVKLFIHALMTNRQLRTLLLLLMISSITLAIYLTLPWPKMANPHRTMFNQDDILFSLQSFFSSLFDFSMLARPNKGNDINFPIWCSTFFPVISSITMWMLLAILIIATPLIYRTSATMSIYKQSFTFFIIAALLFLIIPIGWGMGFAWHFSLSLLMLSILIGFSCEYVCVNLGKHQMTISCGLIALAIGLQTFFVNSYTIKQYLIDNRDRLIFTVLHNAIYHPPRLKTHLYPDSIILIEDDVISSYYITSGGGFYPFVYDLLDYTRLEQLHGHSFIPPEASFNGSLFKWAYSMPSLREMAFPFSMNRMNDVPDTIIYQWLQYRDHIVSIGYNSTGDWSDRTTLFHKNLLRAQKAKNITINHYAELPFTVFNTQAASTLILNYPEQSACQYRCDQDMGCTGFTYFNDMIQNKHVMKCVFYNTTLTHSAKPSPIGTAYIKKGYHHA